MQDDLPFFLADLPHLAGVDIGDLLALDDDLLADELDGVLGLLDLDVLADADTAGLVVLLPDPEPLLESRHHQVTGARSALGERGVVHRLAVGPAVGRAGRRRRPTQKPAVVYTAETAVAAK